MYNEILLVGEAWGADEEAKRQPFVGGAGRLLNSLLSDAGLRRADIYCTNVFNLRPVPALGSALKANDIENLCVDAKSGRGMYHMPPLARGKYVDMKYAPELKRLYKEIEFINPNLIIAAGNTAIWALLRDPRIGKLRGTVAYSVTLPTRRKVLPIYHPAAIMRDWSLSHVTILDLMKAARESKFPEVRRPEREIWIEPEIKDLELFFDTYLVRAKRISIDIETGHEQITCVGFAPSAKVALVIPFVDLRRPGNSYWQTFAEEKYAWNFIRKVLALPAPKVAQNALYDLHWLWRKVGLPTANFQFDSMLMHHAMLIESPKGLDFLGSCYTNEASWKLMRQKGLNSVKREG